MVFKNNIPQPTDNLAKQSQQDLLGNMSQLDTSFVVDHYAFSNLTAANGKHNKVTTPGYVTIPPSVPVVQPTTTTDPIFYGFEPLDAGGVATTNLGLLQYSRGPNNAVTTPVTSLHSTAAPIVLASGGAATTNVFNFTGLTLAIASLYAINTTGLSPTRSFSDVFWDGTNLFLLNNVGNILAIQISGTILQLRNASTVNAMNGVFWTLKLHRVS